MTYFSTFISGLQDFVAERLKKELDDLKINHLLDGLIVYSTKANVAKIKSLKFLNNSFLTALPEEKIKIKIGKSFRVVFSRENELVSVNKEKLTRIENKIAKLNNLRVDRAHPDFEFWFLERSEGYKFSGIRLTKHPDYKTILQKGQLRPELANILCLLSDPQSTDTILDPFAGSGAIAKAQALYPHQKIISADINPKGNEVTKIDATNMTIIVNNSIDKIITDPPWGIKVGGNLDLPDFYSQMLLEFQRVLKPGGKIVVLMGNKEVFEKVVSVFSTIQLVKKFNILVSGKKASIYVFTY